MSPRTAQQVLLGVTITVSLLFNAGALAQRADGAAESAHKYTALLAGRQVIDDFDGPSVEDLAQRIQEAIAADLSAHQSAAASRSLSRQDASRALRDDLNRQLGVVHKSFELESYGATLDEFVEEVGEQLAEVIEAREDELLTDRFAPAFERGRAAAVDGQIARLRTDVYPEQADLDALDERGWTDPGVRGVRDAIIGRVGALVPMLLEEARARAGALAETVIVDVGGQRRAQLAAIGSDPPDDARSREALEAALRGAVTAAIAEMRSNREKDAVVYNPFPSVMARAPERAAELEHSRWRAFLGGFAFRATVGELRPAIEADLAAHKIASASSEIFSRDRYPAFVDAAVEDYIGGLGGGTDPSAFAERLRTFIENDETIAEAAQSGASSGLEPAFGEARQLIAEDQLERHFPSIADSRWRVPDDEAGHAILNAARQAGLEGRASVDGVVDALSLPGIADGGGVHERSRLLEETENRLHHQVGDLVLEGVRADTAQGYVFEDAQPQIDEELFPGRAPLDDLPVEELIERYIERVAEEWRGQRGARAFGQGDRAHRLVANKYDGLFAPLRERIAEHVEAQFERAAEEPDPFPDPPFPGAGPADPPAAQPDEEVEESKWLNNIPLWILLLIAAAVLIVLAVLLWLARRREEERQQEEEDQEDEDQKDFEEEDQEGLKGEGKGNSKKEDPDANNEGDGDFAGEPWKRWSVVFIVEDVDLLVSFLGEQTGGAMENVSITVSAEPITSESVNGEVVVVWEGGEPRRRAHYKFGPMDLYYINKD